jgi:hypothetical protein
VRSLWLEFGDSRQDRLSHLLTCAILFACPLVAQVYSLDLPLDHPAIHYNQGPFDDPVSHLVRELISGKTTLDYRDGALGYLPSLLDHLHIRVDSQALVFSKTSFQAARISPRNPRAVYFADDVAVGFVRGGDVLELAGVDPKQGAVFYTLSALKTGSPRIERRDLCLKCHQGPATEGVPGIFVGSVFPDSTGAPSHEGAIITDHRTAFADRWGGWYVTAQHGEQPDRANGVAANPAEPLTLNGEQNLPALVRKFDVNAYLAPSSDIVALMTLEHQTQMVDLITRAGWQARMGESPDIEGLVAYMLFADETPLPSAIQGVSSFARTFPERGPRDSRGRSLRDFDLQTRLFRYPLSYLIYSAQFDALPDAVRFRVYRRLYEVLRGRDESAKFARLTTADRRAILEIVRDTKPGLPDFWR